MDFNNMEQLTDMGFNRELAAQALAATGGKSTLKATEWILNQRKTENNNNNNSNQLMLARQQVRMDQFLLASSSKADEGTEAEVGASDQKKTFVTRKPSKGKEDEAGVSTRTVLTIADKVTEGVDVKISSTTQDLLPEPPLKKPKTEEQQQKPASSTKLQKKSAKSMVPLAERMRPTSIDEIIGQDRLLGPRGILRSLLETDCLASVIFWGPPGTGKTSLARAIASTVSYKFVALSAVTSGVKEVREVLEEAKKSKKYGQRTLLFLDEVHRFNKAQQDAFLPYVEAGHVIFVGATTENPSFEINAALLSRCKVLTLDKLQTEHLRELIERAISDKEKGVSVSADIPLEMLHVEDKAIHFLAAAADGDARAALNTLDIAVLAASSRFSKESSEEKAEKVKGEQSMSKAAGTFHEKVAKAGEVDGQVLKKESSGVVRRDSFNFLEVLKENVQHSQEEYTRPFKKFVGGKNVTPQGTPVPAEAVTVNKDLEPKTDKSLVVVTLSDAKEALQRSHVFYDKNGEEHYNIISALHKSMRGGDADAAIYWLARMLEGGEGPLYIARRLVRFASEDVGLADPQALQQAVACYQACHFLGMPECNVHLAQCVVYLAMAPKSIVVYQAIEAAQRYVRDKGQNEPVPLHLRNAPTKLMKEMGYSKGYIYPPTHNGPIEQEYMPPSLRGHKFLSWPSPT